MESSLEKKQRVNLLMDCYSDLLTEKQQTYLEYYYQEELQLLKKHQERLDLIQRIEDDISSDHKSLEEYLELLRKI